MIIFKKVIIFIFLSVGILPTDIFLYAQENNTIKHAEFLIENNKIDSLDVVMYNLLKDTLIDNSINKQDLYYLIGRYNYKKNKEEVALEYFRKAEDLFEVSGDLKKIADIKYAKFLILQFRENFNLNKEALDNLNAYYEYANKNKDNKRLVKAFMGYASLNFNPINYKMSLNYFDKALKVSAKIKDTFSMAKIYNNKGVIISNFYGQQDSARIFYTKSLNSFLLLNNKERVFSTIVNIGTSYKNEAKYKEALVYFVKAEEVSIIFNKNSSLKNLFNLMSVSFEKLKNYEKAHIYLTKYLSFKDSVNTHAQNIAISDIQTKYQTVKKDAENLQLKNDKKLQQLILFALASFLVVGFLSYYNMRKKRELADKKTELEHQKVLALIKDQELRSIDAMIEGQEKERKRIAEDLHDALGSKLAVLKLQFDSIIEHAFIDEKKQVKILNSTGILLDETYNVVRSMAHVENAGVIAEQGLVPSVKKLAANISMANKTQIEVTGFGLDKHINNTIEIAIFRIIQELITNIVKHSKANKATIDINIFDDELTIIVSDDGVGFDVNKAASRLGMGITSIKVRVERINGTFVIDSVLGKGTTSIIEISLK